MRRISHKVLWFTAMVVLAVVCAACSTGIEGTKTIKMSAADRRALEATPEELFVKNLHGTPLSAWPVGKQFLVADNRASYLFDASSLAAAGVDSLRGVRVSFEGTQLRRLPSGSDELLLRFRLGGHTLLYPTGLSPEKAADKVASSNVPMLIDLALVQRADSLLRGCTLYTRSLIWYDSIGQPISGRKYVPVKVDCVMPGDMVFPLAVHFHDASSRPAMLLMNLPEASGSGVESRSFRNLFSLSDPKERYPSILPEIWDAICDGHVRNGMTKDECRLAIGNPADSQSGHDWNSTIDIWSYPDGTFLRFQDGILVDRHN